MSCFESATAVCLLLGGGGGGAAAAAALHSPDLKPQQKNGSDSRKQDLTVMLEA